MSIADCITPLISPIQSIDTLIARDSNVNIGGDTLGEFEKA
jgi:hypothetical protein